MQQLDELVVCHVSGPDRRADALLWHWMLQAAQMPAALPLSRVQVRQLQMVCAWSVAVHRGSTYLGLVAIVVRAA